IDVRGRDVGSYVRAAQVAVAREVKLPTGYWLRWSGQYEAIQRVKARLQVVVPLTLGIIALLLYLTFGTAAETAIVMLSLPFALAIMLGLVRALWSHGAGATVMKRIAAPMVGGMVTSTVLTLIVIPVIYYLWRRRGLELRP